MFQKEVRREWRKRRYPPQRHMYITTKKKKKKKKPYNPKDKKTKKIVYTRKRKRQKKNIEPEREVHILSPVCVTQFSIYENQKNARYHFLIHTIQYSRNICHNMHPTHTVRMVCPSTSALHCRCLVLSIHFVLSFTLRRSKVALSLSLSLSPWPSIQFLFGRGCRVFFFFNHIVHKHVVFYLFFFLLLAWLSHINLLGHSQRVWSVLIWQISCYTRHLMLEVKSLERFPSTSMLAVLSWVHCVGLGEEGWMCGLFQSLRTPIRLEYTHEAFLNCLLHTIHQWCGKTWVSIPKLLWAWRRVCCHR